MPFIKPKTKITFLDILNSSVSGRIILLKLIDRIGGFLVILAIRVQLYFKPKIVVSVPQKIKNILIIRPGGIGDAVWLVPMIRLLKQKTGGSVDVLCERRNNAVFNFCRGDIRHIWMYDEKPLKLMNELSRQDYDCVIDTEQYHNFSAIFAYFASTTCRIGFDTVSYRSKMYTNLVPYSQQAEEYQMFLSLLNVLLPITAEEYLQNQILDIPEENGFPIKTFGNDISGVSFGSDIPKDYISIYIGASVKERYWGSVKFAKLCVELVGLGYKIVLVGGKEDINKAKEIKHLFNNDHVIDMVGKISLSQTIIVLKEGLVTVGADSGIMHLACAVDSPALWLFGAGIEAKWLPSHSRHEVINVHVPCSPCTLFGYTPRCPYDIRCLKEISVAQVVEKITYIIKEFKR